MILTGNKHVDERGIITYNNDFDASEVKRIYTIENHSTEFTRGWQGHQFEKRWFAAIKGTFEVAVIIIDDFDNPATDLPIQTFDLTDETLTYLHVPAGCITSITALEPSSKLLVLADHGLGEINDEYRFELEYFKSNKQYKNTAIYFCRTNKN